MSSKYIFYILAATVFVLVIWIMRETFTQPSAKDLPTAFEETAFYRNENNTGPVIRVYAVVAADTTWQDLEAYAKMMPHTKYGNTKVFFFIDKGKSPSTVTPQEPYFDSSLRQFCVARYEKSSMGTETFTRYPFGR